MPLPIILGVAAGIAALTGVGTGIHGGVKMKDAKDTMELAEWIQEKAEADLKEASVSTTNLMNNVGTNEFEILESFKRFSDAIEKIQSRPEFVNTDVDGVEIPKYQLDEIKKVSVGASVLLGGISGAAAGYAGGCAASGATTAIVAVLGTSSTGTAITELSGAAATSATFAALGGGSLAAGGGGIALGTAMLGAASAGVGILFGGIVLDIKGKKLSSKADEAYYQAKETKAESEKAVKYLDLLSGYARRFNRALSSVRNTYERHLTDVIQITSRKTNWSDYTNSEKMTVQNTALLVGLLYKMCHVKLVLKENDEPGKVNTTEIDSAINDSVKVLDKIDKEAA